MKMPQNGSWAITRRFFCWGIARVAPAGILAGLAPNLSLPRRYASQASDYIVINGWVLTNKDALSRREGP